MTEAQRLPEPLARLLGRGCAAVLITTGADGWGHAAMTWAAACAPDRVRFAVDDGSTTLSNLRREGKAALQVIGPDNVLALLKGRARPVRPRMEAAPFPLAMWDLAVTEVKDQSWAPVRVAPLVYHWTGAQAEEFARIERAVLAELRGAPG
jgi:hypothetical protein